MRARCAPCCAACPDQYNDRTPTAFFFRPRIHRTITRNSCLERDAADPIAPLRDAFALPDGVIYLDGNSLGARPKAALARAQEVVANEWGDGLIRSWNQAGWFELPRRLGNKLAPLIGAREDEVVVTDTTSINLFKVLAAAIRVQREDAPNRKIIVSETHNFPTDLYIAEGLADLLRDGYKLRLIDSPDELEGALGDDVAVTMLTHVNYKSGHMYDMAAVSALAHKHGALTLWDLAHSAGAVPVDLHAGGADYAIGCTYKYLNGGPGSPAFVWVAPALRAKSLALTDLLITLVETRCAGFPLTLITPREHAVRGSHVSYEHPNGYAVVQALIARGVVGDYREPRIMRFGFTPLYTSFADVWDAVEVLRDVLETGAWQSAQFNERTLVT